MTARWYVIHVYSGFENKVADAIKERATKAGVEHLVEEVLVPTEQVLEVKRGRRETTEQKLMPGYVLARMELTDQTWHLVKDTPKVTNFLGAGNKPRPISDAEAMRILKQVEDGAAPVRPAITFEIGEQVRVADGPFTSFNGVVEEIDEERTRLKVAVSIFGRSTLVELEYAQVEKV